MIATMLETEKESTTTTTATLLLEDIHFADNDLSRPLYPTLVDYPEKLVDQVQVDLGIQVGLGVDQLVITFRLNADAGVSFTADPADQLSVKLQDLAAPEKAPAGVTARRDSPLVCTFTWNRTDGLPRVRAFRLFCEEAGIKPSVLEIVYGGLFVAIVDSPRLGGEGLQTVGPAVQVDSLAALKLIGIGEMGRPLYNIFKDYSELVSSDADLEIEPTYRVYERQEFRLNFDLGIPAWKFNRELKFLEPPSVRSLFAFTFVAENSSRFSWTRRDTGLEAPETGSASTFHLGVDPGELPDAVFVSLEKALDDLGIPEDPEIRKLLFRQLETVVDPTVIEPPRCSGGICVG